MIVDNLTLNHLDAAVLVTATCFFWELLDYRQSGLFVIISLNFDVLTFFVCARLDKVDAVGRSAFCPSLWEFLYDGESSFLIVVSFDFNIFALDHLDVVMWLLIVLSFWEFLDNCQSGWLRVFLIFATMSLFGLDGSVALRN